MLILKSAELQVADVLLPWMDGLLDLVVGLKLQ